MEITFLKILLNTRDNYTGSNKIQCILYLKTFTLIPMIIQMKWDLLNGPLIESLCNHWFSKLSSLKETDHLLYLWSFYSDSFSTTRQWPRRLPPWVHSFLRSLETLDSHRRSTVGPSSPLLFFIWMFASLHLSSLLDLLGSLVRRGFRRSIFRVCQL